KAFEGCNDTDEFWKKLKNDFLNKYRHEFLVGYPEHNNKVDYDSLRRFSFQFLDAISDVERDMFKGNSSLLKEVIHFFIDYELKYSIELDVEEVKDEVEKTEMNSKNILIN